MSADIHEIIREMVREEMAAVLAQKNPRPDILTIHEACEAMKWSGLTCWLSTRKRL